MGRRSRKRAGSTDAPPVAVREPDAPVPVRAAPRAVTHKSRREEAPQPAWAPFPLTELCILVAIVLLVLGFLTDAHGRPVLIGAGTALASLAAGELALREHFAGYRSHSALLAGVAAIAVLVLARTLSAPQVAMLPVGVIAFAAVFALLRRAFVRRSGGVGFRA